MSFPLRTNQARKIILKFIEHSSLIFFSINLMTRYLFMRGYLYIRAHVIVLIASNISCAYQFVIFLFLILITFLQSSIFYSGGLARERERKKNCVNSLGKSGTENDDYFFLNNK